MDIEYIENKRKAASKFLGFGLFLTLIGILSFALLFANTDNPITGMAIGGIMIITAIVLIIIGSVKYSALRKEFKEKFLKKIIESTLENVTFTPDQGVPLSDIYASRLLKKGDRENTEDLIEGVIDSVSFRTCDLRLEERHVQHTKNGTQVYYVPYFVGRYFEYDFNKEFIGKLLVTESGRPSAYSSYEKVKLESMAFNDKFKTFALDEINAFYVLTPHLMEKMLELEKNNPGKITFLFSNRKLVLLINNSKNTFELNIWTKFTDEEVERFKQELITIKEIVTELQLNKKIFIEN